MDAEDTILLNKVKRGDVKAFKLMFDRYYQSLCVLAFSMVNDYDDAEEIVQDMFVKLWEKRSEISVKKSVKSYLFTAVRNRSLNHISFLKVRENHKNNAINPGRPGYSSQDHLFTDPFLYERIMKVVDDLPPRCGLIFKMSKFQGYKYKEIADELNISPKTVEIQMGKALKILNAHLKDYLPLLILTLAVSN